MGHPGMVDKLSLVVSGSLGIVALFASELGPNVKHQPIEFWCLEWWLETFKNISTPTINSHN